MNAWQTNPNRRLRGGYPALLPWIRQSQFWCRYFLRPQTLDESSSARIASSRRAAWGQRNKDWAGRKTRGWGLGEGGGEKATSLSLFLSSSFPLSKLYKLRITVGCFSTSVFGYGTSPGSCFRNTTPCVLEVTFNIYLGDYRRGSSPKIFANLVRQGRVSLSFLWVLLLIVNIRNII